MQRFNDCDNFYFPAYLTNFNAKALGRGSIHDLLFTIHPTVCFANPAGFAEGLPAKKSVLTVLSAILLQVFCVNQPESTPLPGGRQVDRFFYTIFLTCFRNRSVSSLGTPLGSVLHFDPSVPQAPPALRKDQKC